jgi:hypothetical protein
MTQSTLFPPSSRQPERWKFRTYGDASAFCTGLLGAEVWDDIQILTPDHTKPDRIVQAVKI